MAFVGRLAIAAVAFAFALNVVTTLQNIETTKNLRLVGQELDNLRQEIRVEREARVLKERSATYLVFKKEAELRKELERVREDNTELSKRIAVLAVSLQSNSSAKIPLEGAPVPMRGNYSHDSLMYYLTEAKALFKKAANNPWTHLHEMSLFEERIKDDLLRYTVDSLPLDDLEHFLTSYVRLKLHAFQQLPVDSCNNAPVLSCDVAKMCGFGCQVHHIAGCLIVAHKSGRQLVLQESDWLYDVLPDDEVPHEVAKGWGYFFKPLHSCPPPILRDQEWDAEEEQEVNAAAAEDRREILDNAPYMDTDDVTKSPRVVTLAAVDHRTTGQWAIYYVPPHFKAIIKMFHKVVGYILRLNDDTKRFVSSVRAQIKFRQPAIGIHIRRTDKLNVEAMYHELSEYVERASDATATRSHVLPSTPRPEGLLLQASGWSRGEQETRYAFTDACRIGGTWTQLFSLPPSHQNISKEEAPLLTFVATDDNDECIRLLAANNSQFVCNPTGSKHGGMDTRYSRLSLLHLLADLFLLTECELFVGTFSSQISRLVYELGQTTWRPAIANTAFALSLDDGWYYSG